jgi:N-acetyl-gamma-glutamyl-phosphate reductase
MKTIKVGIVGAAGYTGGETIRLLLKHPQVQIVFAHSTSSANKRVDAIHTDLLGDTNLTFASSLSDDIDVLFLCVGHGDAKKFLAENSINPTVKIIDLSQDFRLKDTSTFGDRDFVYGLPELNKSQIQLANNIANPGCFATAIQLGLLPLAKAGLLNNEVYTTGITGSTGAGQSMSLTSHFSWRNNNIQAYKSLQHQHLNEIGQSLTQLSGNNAVINFIPWRGDFSRGIYISSMVECNLSVEEVNALYNTFYKDAPFTHVSSSMIDLKQVVNTNKCVIHIEKHGNKLAIHSAIDNLLKGASGQAIQNMNLLFGLDEKLGLQLKANQF